MDKYCVQFLKEPSGENELFAAESLVKYITAIKTQDRDSLEYIIDPSARIQNQFKPNNFRDVFENNAEVMEKHVRGSYLSAKEAIDAICLFQNQFLNHIQFTGVVISQIDEQTFMASGFVGVHYEAGMVTNPKHYRVTLKKRNDKFYVTETCYCIH